MSICKLLPIRRAGAGLRRSARPKPLRLHPRPRRWASPRRMPLPRCSGDIVAAAHRSRLGTGPMARTGRRRRDRHHHRQRGLSAAARLLLRRLCLRRPLLLPLRLSAAIRAPSARRISAPSSGARASTRPTRARSGSAPTCGRRGRSLVLRDDPARGCGPPAAARALISRRASAVLWPRPRAQAPHNA